MRVARVLTNETCNQNCGFCNARRSREQVSFVRRSAVTARIQQALDAGSEEIVLTGGEPTLRADLPELVAHARARGARRISIETNATLITDQTAVALAAAGVVAARVNLPAWGDACDAITRDPGGFVGALAGARALQRAGMAIDIAVPIVRENLDTIAELPERLKSSGIAVAALVLAVPIDGPDERQLVSLDEATRAVEVVETASRRVGLPVRFDQTGLIPPCAFAKPARVAHLYTLTPGGVERPGYQRVPSCEQCCLRDRCPGVPEAVLRREPRARFLAITDDRVRRRLSVISSLGAQIERELVTREITRSADGIATPMHTIRVNFHCNQACHFCFVSTHLPPPEQARVREAIIEAGRAGAILALSGGEPTLNDDLADYVRLAKQAGVKAVELQTNAVRLSDGSLARELAEAGVDVAFVSLHGSKATICDAVTNAPGTYDKTVRGLDALHRTRIEIRVNFVFCQQNSPDFPDLVRLVASRWPGALLTVSFVAPSTDLVPRERWLIPRYSDVMPSMAKGLRLARELGVGITGFESMCGVPLCLVPQDLQSFFALSEITADSGSEEFVKPDECSTCALDSRCHGLRRRYDELYGSDELVAVTRD